MYAKVFNLKFVDQLMQKLLLLFAENLAKFIRPCNMQSISISLGACGSLTITAKFDSGSDLKTFGRDLNQFRRHKILIRLHSN